MVMKSTAIAHPMQGLLKYHGLKDWDLRIPYHDSISFTLDSLWTKTSVEFGNFENVLKKADQIKQNKRRESLIENKDKATISRKLVTLKKDVPVKNEITEFDLKNIDKDKLYTFLREMEFNRLLSSVILTYGEPKLSSQNIDSHAKEKQLKC